jgi:hypothetical protein
MGRSVEKPVGEHRQAAHRVGLADLVLNDVPVLSQKAILDPEDIGDDPVSGLTVAGEATVEDDVVAVR